MERITASSQSRTAMTGGHKRDVQGPLSPMPVLAITRWLLAPARQVSAEIHAALIKERDVSAAAIISSVANLGLFNGWCCWATKSPAFIAMLAANIMLSALRLAACHLVIKSNAASKPVRTDLYVLVSLAWFGLQGVVSGFAMQRGDGNLEVLATACIMALMGLLCGRNY